MADNKTIKDGATVDFAVAADDIASVFYQRIKLSLGADGTAVDAVAGAGTVNTGVQRITLASDDPAVAHLATIATAAADTTTPVPVAIPTSAYDVQTTITRPANVTAYTALDVVGGAIDLGTLGPSAKAIMIVGSQLQLDIAAIPSGMTSFRLWLYSVTPPSAIADNGVFSDMLPSGDRASFLGFIDLGTPIDIGSSLYVEQNGINKQVKLAGTKLFGYLQTTGGYTPAANSEVYRITLHTQAV